MASWLGMRVCTRVCDNESCTWACTLALPDEYGWTIVHGSYEQVCHHCWRRSLFSNCFMQFSVWLDRLLIRTYGPPWFTKPSHLRFDCYCLFQYIVDRPNVIFYTNDNCVRNVRWSRRGTPTPLAWWTRLVLAPAVVYDKTQPVPRNCRGVSPCRTLK